ncbi:flhB hrpN yscU spaS family domain-containing protein [Ditylenchus destructor]|uniref:FlhB hrpN yscU spaS family domain-containing protein n=1 Tax=Ditylenchus destructor TaxID=166010 RepID=A0AAD4MF24_9BILA|nr:flhB hrpN yscU spaS family domain-containing protein [Ditylenchus destructor]
MRAIRCSSSNGVRCMRNGPIRIRSRPPAARICCSPNPTHLAIALDYDPVECPVPVIAAKGEGPLAAAMRAEAEREGVPIVRNVPLARTIFATAAPGEMIPKSISMPSPRSSVGEARPRG